MSKPWIFISPSSRGIGHALTRHLLRTTTLPILATSRSDPSSTKFSLLQDSSSAQDYSSRLTVLQVDVTDESTITTASSKAAELFPQKTHHLHLGFAIPGILHPEKSPAQVEWDNALETMKVNVLGPMMLMKHFGEFLPRKSTSLSLPNQAPNPNDGEEDALNLPNNAVWTNLSARVGSIGDNRLGGWYSYRASKSAVNSLTKTFDLYLRNRSGGNAVAVAYHPGTVKTELSKEFWGSVTEGQLFSPEFAAERLAKVVCSRGDGERGRIWDWRGEEVSP
ncbi:oxidoreductase [Pseudomassariella vexata]|uniref:Oxidoreductase n=1 Tax=Pseudomassariella vexata TaxID=1141098 RepID=A0A1Y2DMT2_9PEZI|nr:oxidoreductase [Pseudomassariella vexata]ORY60560.1 oxidoreductase [Pseudomassariella vexata]